MKTLVSERPIERHIVDGFGRRLSMPGKLAYLFVAKAAKRSEKNRSVAQKKISVRALTSTKLGVVAG